MTIQNRQYANSIKGIGWANPPLLNEQQSDDPLKALARKLWVEWLRNRQQLRKDLERHTSLSDDAIRETVDMIYPNPPIPYPTRGPAWEEFLKNLGRNVAARTAQTPPRPFSDELLSRIGVEPGTAVAGDDYDIEGGGMGYGL